MSKPPSYPGQILRLRQRHTKLNVYRSLFFHKKSYAGENEPYVGQAVSYLIEAGLKGAAAVNVKEEEGGVAEVEDEEEREMGKVKVCKLHSLNQIHFQGEH